MSYFFFKGSVLYITHESKFFFLPSKTDIKDYLLVAQKGNSIQVVKLKRNGGEGRGGFFLFFTRIYVVEKN